MERRASSRRCIQRDSATSSCSLKPSCPGRVLLGRVTLPATEAYISSFRNGVLRARLEERIESELKEAKDRFSAGDSTVFERPWGWKDPRNSVNLHFWLRHFPEAKILMVKKDERSNRSKSVSGKWFRESTDFQREFYYNPRQILDLDAVAADRIQIIQFDDITSRQESLDLATQLCGLGQHPLTGVLNACRYEA